MSQFEKLESKMRNNPKGWVIEDLRKILKAYGFVEGVSGRGSHVTFSHPDLVDILTIPVHKPIKPVYVKQIIAQIDYLKENK